MKRLVRLLYRAALILAVLLVGWINVQVLQAPTPPATQGIVQQLNFLHDEISGHELAQRMQYLFPEGYVFTHALYGLAWAELGAQLPPDSTDLYFRALEQARNALAAIESEEGKAVFTHGQEVPYGTYYQGWRGYLMAKIVIMQHCKAPASEVAAWRDHC